MRKHNHYYGIRVGDTMLVNEVGGNVTEGVRHPVGTEFKVKSWPPKTFISERSKDKYEHFLLGVTAEGKLVRILMTDAIKQTKVK